MRLDDYSKEMMDENSFIDMSHIYLQEQGKEKNLYDIIDKFKKVGGYTDDEIENRVLQFYTDLNTDGRFLSTGEGVWGLRDWYSVDDISDKIAPTIHKIELAVEEEDPIVYDEVEAFDQDKELVEDDTEDLDSPLNDNEVESEDDLDEAMDDSIDESVEYDDTDELEDSYEDKPDL
ncbi:DNA-directed RNA polymerase subunit delta [Salinicoccus halodurans]|uniref:Probable DNA-directed RNA polymerase subunit delta n=1 Tax=Salinicoccus halodurans TaxID=407035 RepID=A0A0F7D4T8_9STAP|nr:DNA-directed RNA polymerase subunit delta [Salinicoccus halodurans]AKG74810.1 DNA-directed RNA polymerase subunit delta [Salinicoccus halodurans]SFK70003.1 DNA-directed RNA polymerase subunit delta [Salinicoccus halodurans]